MLLFLYSESLLWQSFLEKDDGKINPLENAEKQTEKHDAGGNFWSSLGMRPGMIGLARGHRWLFH